jgi:hypothetical protein
MNTGITAINQEVEQASAFTRPLFNEIGKIIIGQTYLVERLVIGLLASGHVLLEGVPGLAKTLSVKSSPPACIKFSRPVADAAPPSREDLQPAIRRLHRARDPSSPTSSSLTGISRTASCKYAPRKRCRKTGHRRTKLQARNPSLSSPRRIN